MSRRKILFLTDYCGLFTGFGVHIKNLLSYIYKNYPNKYEIILAAGGQYNHNPDFSRWPWKVVGTLPVGPGSQEKMKQSDGFRHEAAYGKFTLDLIVQDYKPDVCCLVQDSWGNSWAKDMEFTKRIPTIYHITLDSLPLLDQAFEVAKTTKYYWTWAEFAAKRMREKPGTEHVQTVYPCIDTSKFFRLPDKKRLELRAKFNIPKEAKVFGFVFRNQPRKLINKLIEGYALFKKNNPETKTFLLTHTSYHEDLNTGAWNIPVLVQQYAVKNEEVLCTYICRATKNYYVAPFQGEGLDNTIDKHPKSLFTADVVNGCSTEQLNEVYNLMDAYIGTANSGACEIGYVESALTELPVAAPRYSYGEDIIDFNKGSYQIQHDEYTEIKTQFLKANSRPDSIASIMEEILKLPEHKLREKGKLSRQWALENYDVKINAEKILKAIDAIPQHTWDFKVDLKRAKNPDYPMLEIKDDVEFILDLYKNILNSFEETKDTKGCLDWQTSLKAGVSRQKIYEFFCDVARNDNKGLGTPQTFVDLLQETGRKRILFVLKESGGDILNSTSLLPSLVDKYPDHDVYYACDPKFAGIVLGNPNIFAILPYDPMMENELQMIGTGPHKGWFDVYLHAGIGCQRQLNYLSHNQLGIGLK